MNDHSPTAEALPWRRSYDRTSVERFLADIDAERTRLQRAIEQVRRERVAVAAGVSDRTAALGAAARAAWRELEHIEGEHREIVATIRAAAETESSRILGAAHREVVAIRASAASLASLMGPEHVVLDLDGEAGSREMDDEPGDRADAG